MAGLLSSHLFWMAVFLVVGTLLGGVLRGWLTNHKRALRFRKGREGEARARAELLRRGFTIVAEQPRLEGYMSIDGERRVFTVRADFLVKRGGERAIVEVKTGKKAPDPAYPATRRQLFEYAHLFGVDALFLLDGEKLTLVRVEFDAPSPGSRHLSPLFWIAGGVSVALLLWWLLNL